MIPVLFPASRTFEAVGVSPILQRVDSFPKHLGIWAALLGVDGKLICNNKLCGDMDVLSTGV